MKSTNGRVNNINRVIRGHILVKRPHPPMSRVPGYIRNQRLRDPRYNPYLPGGATPISSANLLTGTKYANGPTGGGNLCSGSNMPPAPLQPDDYMGGGTIQYENNLQLEPTVPTYSDNPAIQQQVERKRQQAYWNQAFRDFNGENFATYMQRHGQAYWAYEEARRNVRQHIIDTRKFNPNYLRNYIINDLH